MKLKKALGRLIEKNFYHAAELVINAAKIDGEEHELEKALVHMIDWKYYGAAEFMMGATKIDYSYRGPSGKTIFSFACKDGNYKLCSMMSDVDINARDKKGYTALYYSMEHPCIFEMIISKFDKVDMGVLMENKYTILICSLCDKKSLKMINLILDHKSDCMINLKQKLIYGHRGMDYKRYFSSHGEKKRDISALDVALANNLSHDIVKTLLGHGAAGKYIGNLPEIQKIFDNRFTYLPEWDCFKTYRYYPKEFNDIAVHFIWCCKQLGVFSKGIVYLLVKYLAEEWKWGKWTREGHIKALKYENDILKKMIKSTLI